MSSSTHQHGLDLHDRLNAISRRAQVLTGADAVAIAIERKGLMICRASLGSNAPPIGARLNVDSGFSGECIRSREVLRCNDSESDVRVDKASCRALGVRAILAAPILLNGQVAGLLEVFSTTPFAFDDAHVALLESVARHFFDSPSEVSEAANQGAAAANLQVENSPATKSAGPVHFHGPAVLRAQTAEPARFSVHILAPAPTPWKGLVHSAIVHCCLAGLLAVAFRPGTYSVAEVYPDVRAAQAVYYRATANLARGNKMVPRQHNRVAGKQMAATEQTTNVVAEAHEAAAFKVKQEQARNSRATSAAPVQAPEIKLVGKLQLLQVLASSSLTPIMPAAAIRRSKLTMPAALVGVVPPPPEASGALRRAVPAPLQAVVGPAPSLQGARGGIGEGSGVSRRGVKAPDQAVVGPAPSLQGARGGIGEGSGVSRRGVKAPDQAVIGPAPSLQGSGAVAGRRAANAGPVEVIGPAPELPADADAEIASARGAERVGVGNDWAAVIPPSPSGDSVAVSSRRVGSLPSSGTAPEVEAPPVAEAVAAPPPVAAPPSPHANVPSPAPAADRSIQENAQKGRLSVDVLGPAVPPAPSSFFASSEIFVAEAKLTRQESRLIKLVYDFLPYQRRLSEYGPNYPEIVNLRALRDPTCDESVAQLISTADSNVSQTVRTHVSTVEETQRVPCFRTTADDFRRAQEKKKSKH